MSCDPCIIVPAWVPPTVAQFKTQFFRDFPYAPTLDPTNLNFVTDTDIQNAINQGNVDFNSGIFGVNATLIFMFLAAHIMVVNIRTSSAGLGSLAKFPTDSSSVGGVSISNNIPGMYADYPQFAKYLTTGYGKIYLDMAFPYTIGAGIGIVFGTVTNA